ncbi:1-acyl-sn-glycerol-3-phosphate acyltransferase [Candidatus Woesearchaeota archaeon]|nr:1-acyl-sn-glycerol-3-phosphate acyltransferase [Candidatus Woesearchaeota archaeon]
MLYSIILGVSAPSLYFVKDITGIENIPEKGAFIIASNHSSYLDPMILPCMFIKYFKKQVHYLGKKELFESWVGNKIHNAAGTIPVDKGKKGKVALKSALKALKEEKIIGIFPEGGRSRTGRLEKGKTGVARLALWSQVPVIPIGINGSYEVWPSHKKIFRFKKEIYVNIGKPMYFDRYYNKKLTKQLLRTITTKIMKKIASLTGMKYNFK